jgi:hypothetical protein
MNLQPVNSLKIQYFLEPRVREDIYPTNSFNICNLSKLELTIPYFKKYNTRSKFVEVSKTSLFFEIILNRLEFYKPELRFATLLDADIEEYKELIGCKLFMKGKNVGLNRHNFNPVEGTFESFLNSTDLIWGYIDKEGNCKALNSSVVCKLPLGEPFAETALSSMKHMDDSTFYSTLVDYQDIKNANCFDLFGKQLEVLDVSKSILDPKISVGQKVVHQTDYMYRTQIAQVSRQKDKFVFFTEYKSIVAKEETEK